MANGASGYPCTVVLHDNTVSEEDVLCGTDVLPAGSIGYLVAPGTKALCIHAQAAATNADEVSVHVVVARRFGFENRMKANVQQVENIEQATAGHVELLFRDQHLSRADMWRMKAEIDGSVLYLGQKLDYLGSTTANVEAVYVAGNEVPSAYVSHPETKLIFRSGSARYTILIQVSKEMLEDWVDGDLMYERLISGFFPELFRRWDDLKVRHSVTVVIFGRRLQPWMPPISDGKDTERNWELNPEREDFFHIIASDMSSGDWRDLQRKLKRAFNDVRLPRQLCLAAKGNMLEAIHLAAMDFTDGNIDLRLSSTGTSVVAITAGAGLFEADHELLRRTTKLLMGNSVGVDIISLSPKPLHPVPFFQYRRNDRWEYALPHWVDVSYWKSHNTPSSSAWLLSDVSGDVNDIAISPLDASILSNSGVTASQAMDAFDEDLFSSHTESEFLVPVQSKTRSQVVEPRVEMKRPIRKIVSKPFPESDSELSEVEPEQPAPPKIVKRQTQLPHPLMQTGRKISLGPKGLALSQGVASTTVSAQHAQNEREATTVVSGPATIGPQSGIAKQIRESLRRKPSQSSIVSRPIPDATSNSKPMVIQTAEKNQIDDHKDPASLVEKAVMEQSRQAGEGSGDSSSATPKASLGSFTAINRKSFDDQDEPASPWLTLLNPCNPRRQNMRVASEYRQWQNVFPRAVSSGAFKWDSVCTPAVLPLMTEHRISLHSLEKTFTKKIRRLVATNSGAQHAMLQMIAMRLIFGFQIVPMRKLPREQMPSERIERMLLSLGARYHELRCLSDVEVQVSEYERDSNAKDTSDATQFATLEYSAGIKTLATRRERPVQIQLSHGDGVSDWSPLDDQTVNPSALTDNLGTSRMRIVLIPVEIPRGEAQTHSPARELSDEERRIDGIQRLTQLWQRNRYFTDEDERHRSAMHKQKTSGTVDRDPNPLAIEYQTRDPSAVVSAYGTNLTGPLPDGETLLPLFAESEMYHSSNFDMVKLVKQMQELPPAGVELRDRRWLTRLHLKCFRGDEMTNWLLRVFKDLQTREDAVALGNQLMDKGIFTHVRGKHEFRDGNYFYQIKSAHRTTDYPDTAGFFAKGLGRSVPSTPISELKHSPIARPAQNDSDSSSRGTPTPTLAPVDKKEKKEILLSQLLQYNVDHSKKSSQLEIVNLHYDRIHNPDNCYHIQLDWTSTTPKLIRESVTRWTSLVESHGLRLVQLPLAEASKIHEQHPFEETISVRLSTRPPDRVLATPHLDPHTFSPRLAEDRNGCHKALLRKLDFVLDLEAASSFPRRLDVSYSWGRPDYELTQFVHKSGFLLAQVSNDGESDFLLLRNRLGPQGAVNVAKRAESSPLESLVQNFMAFCRNEAALKALFEEVNKPKVSTASPLSNAALALDVDVPPMELPPHLIHRTHKPNGST